MRYMAIPAAIVLGLTTMAAFAQSYNPPPYNPPSSTAGARPGHDIGVGDSLPRSNKASNISPSGGRSDVAPTLPSPEVGDNAAAYDYLKSARNSLAAGRTGQAQQSLEMAETRALDRSVPQDQTNSPSDSPFIARIREARHALGSGDRAQAIRLIDGALPH
jgi:hypothetical protein